MTDQEWFDLFKHSLKIAERSLIEATKHLNKKHLWPEELESVTDFFEFRQWLHDTRRTERIESSFALQLIAEWHREIRGSSRLLENYEIVFEDEPKIVGLLIHARMGLKHARRVLGLGYLHFKHGPSSSDIDQYLSSLEASFQSD
ncbi:MAG: hypothetical protein IT410_00770 [Candidatus Doudnabacteria bacterium]|nr:hypothetical protein [Candidatus Doudnabacteria bacterium]